MATLKFSDSEIDRNFTVALLGGKRVGHVVYALGGWDAFAEQDGKPVRVGTPKNLADGKRMLRAYFRDK